MTRSTPRHPIFPRLVHPKGKQAKALGVKGWSSPLEEAIIADHHAHDNGTSTSPQ
ncbi:hypothetical protein ACTMTI_05065 [Nonomuraea sp. H19]|uniref:hypothetical protein n=1 Tax=Nonomuraea sp. H19 TaxID=3452206 RepID=UPI003F8A6B39